MTPHTVDDKPSWVYRFDNYTRALTLLREAVDAMRERHLSDLEKQGLILRFEFTCELAWKLMKDYLEHTEVRLETITPAVVIREANALRIIENGDLWMQSLTARNRTSHIYDLKTFEKILADIGRDYLPLFEALQRKLRLSTPKSDAMQAHGLSDRHIDIIRGILAPYADRILRVAKTLLTQYSAPQFPFFR